MGCLAGTFLHTADKKNESFSYKRNVEGVQASPSTLGRTSTFGR